MKTCPQCGGPISRLRSFLNGLCRKCRQEFEEKDRQRAEAESAREWNLTQVGVEEERKWRPDRCPFCGKSMLTGYIWVTGADGSLVWAAREIPYESHDIRLLRTADEAGEAASRRAHLCEDCGSLIAVQALREVDCPGPQRD